jgi:hypothetical protein
MRAEVGADAGDPHENPGRQDHGRPQPQHQDRFDYGHLPVPQSRGLNGPGLPEVGGSDDRCHWRG